MRQPRGDGSEAHSDAIRTWGDLAKTADSIWISKQSCYFFVSAFVLLSSLHPVHSYSHTMAPSLEEPVQVDLDAPLKAASKLVAPEPGIPPMIATS